MIRPAGLTATVVIPDDTVDAMVALTFVVNEDETVTFLLSAEEVMASLTLLLATAGRAHVANEMTTMFPEQRDSILQTLYMRWMEDV